MMDQKHGWNTSTKPLWLGLTLSLIMLLGGYRIVTAYHLPFTMSEITLFSFAIGQALIQLVFFLQLGLEEKPYWNIITFLFMVIVIIVIVGGSLWIMSNINYNTMDMS